MPDQSCIEQLRSRFKYLWEFQPGMNLGKSKRNEFVVSCIYHYKNCLAEMSQLLGSQGASEAVVIEVRRSGRKRVKLNHKKNPLLSKPTKQKHKRVTEFKPSRNFDVKPPKIKVSPYENSKRLDCLGHSERSQVVDNMKQAIKEQQRKLKQLFSIKLIQERGFSEEKISWRNKKVEQISTEKTQTSIKQEKMNSEDYESEFEVKRDLMQIGTAEQIEYGGGESNVDSEVEDMVVQDSAFYLSEIPTFKKQTSKLLSDNYENQELLYTIEHIVPSWHQEQIDYQQHMQFSSQ